MEAARLLRYLLSRDIQALDVAMGVNVEIDQLLDFIDFDNEDITDDDHSNNIIPNNQPITSNTYPTNPTSIVIYDDNDPIEFIFDESETYQDDDIPELNLDDDDVIEI